MKKFKNVFLAFFVTALTSLNLALPAYAEETTTQTVDSAGFSVSVVGDGTVTANDKGNYTFEMPASDVTISVSFEAVKKETADAETEKKETEEVKANIFDEFFDKYKYSCT